MSDLLNTSNFISQFLNNNVDNNKKYINNVSKQKFNFINHSKISLENNFNNFIQFNNDYYNHVLFFLNLLFDNNATSILKIKSTKIILTKTILIKYNEIVKQFNLNEKLFNIDDFDFSIIYNKTDIITLIKKLTQNLLNKLNYKILISNSNNKYNIKFKLISSHI